MRRTWDMAGTWQLVGWWPNTWASARYGAAGNPDVATVPAPVPGSVRGALVDAGIVPDPYRVRAYRDSEWIEHRHWAFSRDLPSDLAAELGRRPEARLVLRADSLDYAGKILLDLDEVGAWRGSLTPVEFDITEAVRAGATTLTVQFTGVAGEMGLVGWTSEIREWKARFGYYWDWTPRLVQIGIAGPIALELQSGTELGDVLVTTDYDEGSAGGTVAIRAEVPEGTPLAIEVRGPGVDVERDVSGPGPHRIDVGAVEPWRLLPSEPQPFYDVRVAVAEPDGSAVIRRVGFRSIHWLPNEGAPDGAEPWICVVNGTPTFLGGANWIPVRPDYADVTEHDHRTRLEAYRDMGVRILRVWGGGALESEAFYDLCDELGILVWQELPLSCSGLNNTPPRDDEYVEQLREVATSYVYRRAHHPSLIMWDAGNELTDEADWVFDVLPLSADHPAAAAAAEVFAELDPDRRFVVTSPSGPSMWGLPWNWGKQLHHDVHGPWDQFSETFEEWQDYWNADDSLMRSEVGVSGASPMDILEEFGLTGPFETDEDRAAIERLWADSAPRWLRTLKPREATTTSLAEHIEAHQRRQATFLAYAAQRTVDRFPEAGGFIVWMGHDTYPAVASQAVLDFHGRPKPAGLALGEVFRNAP
jgi:beta-mannosidase